MFVSLCVSMFDDGVHGVANGKPAHTCTGAVGAQLKEKETSKCNSLQIHDYQFTLMLMRNN